MELTIFAFPVILAGLLISSSDKVIRAFLVCFVFGGTATLSLTALGGAPILPSVLFLPFILRQVILINSKTKGINPFFPSAPGFWLILLIMYEVLSAVFLPRIFGGETMVYSADRTAFSGVALQPLQPVSTNLTQSFYSVLGLIAYFAIAKLINNSERLIAFAKSVFLIASLDIMAALIQFGETYLGLPAILAEVRNANYAMFDNYEVGGLMRIQGTFPEASSFSAFTLPLFAFTFRLFRQNVMSAYSGTISMTLLVLLLISTSSTTYFSLAMYFMCTTLLFIKDNFWKGLQLRTGMFTTIAWLLLVVICLLLLTNPQIIDILVEFFDLTLFNKLDSSSGKERSAWNWQGINNFIETYGIGIGFASNRSSNFFVALISNVGVLGSFLFLGFLWKTATSKVTKLQATDAQIMSAAKNSILISLFSLFASAGFADPGMMFYVFAAVAAYGNNRTSKFNYVT